MKRICMVALCLMVVSALSVVAASSAFAAEGPFYKVKGVRLATGASKEITAKASASLVLHWSALGVSVSITCKKLEMKSGSLIGSNTWEPGRAKGTIAFLECTQEGLGASCEVENKIITTKELADDLKWSSLLLTENGPILMKFGVATGTHFTDIKFVGSGCPVTEVAVTGSVSAEVLVAGKVDEVGKEPAESAAVELRFPTTAITKDWLSTGATAMTAETVGLEALGKAVTLEGTSAVELVSKELWGVYTK